MTDEGRSLYERAAAAADAGEIAAPERRPTLRAEKTYVIEENIIKQADREQAEAWAELEALRAENERLREALERWEAVVNSVTSGHNKLGLNGYDIVDAELRILRYGRKQDAQEIERLRAERDRWCKIADGFYEAGSNRVAHSEVAEECEGPAVADDDVVEDLRGALRRQSGGRFWQSYFRRAADEIERLRATADELAEALRDARRRHQCDCVDGYDERSGAAALAEWEKVQSGGDDS